jgi:hypothetical protein
MENFFSAIPFGGLAMLMLAFYRLGAIAIRFKSRDYVTDLSRFLWKKITGFIRDEFRLLTVFIFSVTIYSIYKIFLPNVSYYWYIPVIAGTIASILTMFFTMWSKSIVLAKKRLSDLFFLMTIGKGISNAWGLLIYISSLLLLVWLMPANSGLDFLFLITGFGIGSSGMIIFAMLTDAESLEKQDEQLNVNFVKTENFDILLSLSIAVILAGFNFSHNQLPIIYALILAVSGLLFSTVMKALSHKSVHFYAYRSISALLLAAIAMVLNYTFLPEYQVVHYHEISRLELLYAVFTGILYSWVIDKTVSVHHYVLQLYNYFIKSRYVKINWLHMSVDLLMKSFSSLLVIGVSLAAYGIAYQNGGLYGLLLAAIAAFSLSTNRQVEFPESK